MKKRISGRFAQCHRLIMTELGLEFRFLEMWFIFPILFFILVLKLNLILGLISLWIQFLGWIHIHEISRSSLSLRTVSVQFSRVQLFATLWTAALQASLLHKDTPLTAVFHAYDHHSCSSHLYHMHRAMLPKVCTKGRQFPEIVHEIKITPCWKWYIFSLFKIFYAILNIKGAEKSSANKPIFLKFIFIGV